MCHVISIGTIVASVRYMPKSHSLYSLLIGFSIILIMWISFFADKMTTLKFYEFGILPKTASGFRGIFFSPFIHDNREYSHLFNNSIPTLILTFIIHQRFYNLFWKVFLLSWILSGSLVWLFAENTHSYHIGMSGVIYALAAFVFTIGVLIKHLPYQALSLFIVFIYGSLIWGIFPSPQPISWEGHLAGLLTGVCLAFMYKRQIPSRPKYSYEIEKELGIEPPDWEAVYNAQINEEEILKNAHPKSEIKIVYELKENDKPKENK